LLVFCGAGGIIVGVFLCCTCSTHDPDWLVGLLMSVGGALAIVVGFGLYAHRTWALILALLFCLGGPYLIWTLIVRSNAKIAKSEDRLIWGMIVLVPSPVVRNRDHCGACP
jgi:hypothetical protein